jgi:hypothetical protein
VLSKYRITRKTVKTALAAHSYIIRAERIIFTRNLITFAVLHENSLCFVKMKAEVIIYIIHLSKFKNYFYFTQRVLTQSVYI